MRRRLDGKLVIILMLLVGVGAAGFAWFYRLRLSSPSLAAWGESASVVRLAQKVDLLALSGPSPEADTEEEATSAASGQLGLPAVAARYDISAAPGLIHLRHALLHAKGIEWQPTDVVEERADNWQFALRFQDPRRPVTVWLDLDQERIYVTPNGRSGNIAAIADALRTYVSDLTSDVDAN